ncbi:MAG: CtsR family transcriptional regulator [Bacillota bacterium]|nr:CtsR family transcriptional regulator [Bacillota bacterium]
MPSLTEQIEQWLKEQLLRAGGNILEIRRSDLAEIFDCVPSQVNYVLSTRFTVERGFLVQSRRGGGGFIRIIKLRMDLPEQLQDLLKKGIGESISQAQAEGIIKRLWEEELLNERERRMLEAAVSRDTLGVGLPLRDVLRARLLKAMLLALLGE